MPTVIRPLTGLTGRRFVRLACLAAFCGWLALSASHAAEEVRKLFNVPAGPAETTLKQFSEQSGHGVIFVTSAVQGIETRAVQGELAVREALDLMITGTPLAVTQDAKTGAFAIKRDNDPNGSGAELATSSDRPVNRNADGTLKLDNYDVHSARINGPVNQTIFKTTETGAFNYDVISRVDIDRMGVTSMEELLRFVPQTSDYGANSLQGQVANPQSPGGATFQNSEVKLRGFSSLQTSILVNGRRLQRGNLTAGPDLSRIPVAAIERIEILPSSASAIYGGGAIGGAINIVLRKDYAGHDLTAYYGTSTDGGASEYHFTYFEGRSFNNERTRLSLTLDYTHKDPLYLDDRDYLQRALDRYPPSSALLVGGRPIYEQYIIPAFAANPGTIVINAATGGLGIPGNPDARFAAIPLGTTPTAANSLTPGSFATTAGTANMGTRFGRSVLYRPEDRYSLNAQFEHAFVPEKLEFYSELGFSYMRSQYSFPALIPALNLTATDPLNPFRTGVTPGFVGRPVTIYLDSTDLPDPSIFQERQGARAVLGFKGKLGDRWDWSVDGTGEYGRSHSDGVNPTQNLAPFILNVGTGSLTQAQRRALYNPLADHAQYPSSDAMAPYIDYKRQFTYYNYLAQANFRLVGDVLDLPAGPLRVSPGAEIIWFQGRTNQYVYTSPDYLAALGGAQGVNSVTRNSRRTESVFLESVIPLVGGNSHPIPIDSAELNVAGRWEGTDDSTDKFSPTFALRVAPIRDIAFRVSYAEGFFPPDQSNYEGSRVTENAVTPGNDPFRGNTPIPPRTEISGGNPNLLPETSKAWNYGIIVTPRFAPDLTLTVDFWTIEKKNAISVINGPSFVVAAPDAYPGRVVRADPTPADVAAGWLGVVTLIDWRPINVGFTKTNGADIRLRYQYKTQGAGDFTFMGTATWTESFRDQILITNPIVERSASSGNPLTWRGYGSVFWERKAWTAGLTVRYIDHYKADSTTPSPAFPTATGFDGEYIPSATLFDFQLGYRIPVGAHTGWAGWLNATQWTLGCENLFNKEPEYRTDRYGFYSRYENPRQRFVSLQVRKSL